MSISGSLYIAYGIVGGSGRGALIEADKFKDSDLNFYITVKVTNQITNIKDASVYCRLSSVTELNLPRSMAIVLCMVRYRFQLLSTASGCM